nr:PREDICTED: leucine-rich repeat extensin-like protein 5 [Paralichthys olivaceus]
MDPCQNSIQDRKVLGNQDQTQKENQDQTSTPQDHVQSQNQIHQRPDQLQNQVQEEEENSVVLQAPLRNNVQTETKRNPDLTARTNASHLTWSCGLRKVQSVQSLLSDTGDTSCPGDIPPQRPTTLPSTPRRPPSSSSLPHQRPSPSSPIASSAATTVRKSSSSSSSAPSAPRSYMSPTASSMAKMSRSISVGDGLNVPEPTEDGVPTSSVVTPSSQVRETPPPLVAVVPSNAALAVPPHAAVVPVVAPSPSSSSLGNQSNQAAPPTRGLQARVPGSGRPLPDKPSLTSFSPSSKSAAAPSSSTCRPPPLLVSPLTYPWQGVEPQTPAGRDDPGLDSSSS